MSLKEIQEKDYDHLLQRVTKERTKELEALFDDYRIAEQADLVFLNSNLLRKFCYVDIPPTIKEIRQILGKVEQKIYYEEKKKISERKIYRYFPWFIVIERDISNGKTKVEAEIEYLLETNFKEEVRQWEKYSISEILQKFKDMSEIVGVVWEPKPEVDYSIIVSHRRERREFPVNLLHRERYYNLIRNALRSCRVERTKYIPHEKEDNMGFGVYEPLRGELFFGEALMAVLNFSTKYQEEKHGHFPGYLQRRLDSYLRDIWKRREFTTTALYKKRRDIDEDKLKKKGREAYRILRSDLEFSGGSLDEEIVGDEGKKGIKRVDLVQDERCPSEDSLNEMIDFKKRKDSISDPLEKEIFVGYFGYEDKTMTEIGKDLGISRQAVAKRIKEIEKHIKGIIK